MRVVVWYDAKRWAKKEQAVTRKVLTNFLAGEEEQPLEREFDLNLNLLFNTVRFSRRLSVLTGGTIQGYVRTLSYDHARAGGGISKSE